VIALALLLLNQVEFSKIITWVLFISITFFFRVLIVYHYNRTKPSIGSVEKWGRNVYLISLLGGLIWGASGVYLFPYESFPHQIFVLLILGGLCAGVVATYSSLKWNVTIFSLLALLPITVIFFLEKNEVSTFTGFITLIFLAFVIVSSMRVYDAIKESLELRIENVDLITKLEGEKNRVEILNVDLQDEIEEHEKTEAQKEKLIEELQQALKEIKQLSGLLPICSECKKIRDEKGSWHQIEEYIASHSEAVFSHGICPDCKKKLYPNVKDEDIANNNNT
jgi:hypothetical protein